MIVTWRDLRQGTLAIVLVIIPTILLSTYTGYALQSYHITGAGLWELKLKNIPDELIDPLHELRLKPFFFKFKLMNEIESRIDNPELFNKYKKHIEGQVQTIQKKALEYIFLAILAFYYSVLWYTTRMLFLHRKV